MRVFYCTIFILTVILIACGKKQVPANSQEMLEGVWVREFDNPGRQPADTLEFSNENGKNILRFYCAGSPGPNWPSEARTEYRFGNEKLSYKDYSGSGSDFYQVESFQWVKPGKTFSVKLYQVLLYMSADYRVTYQKIR